MSDSFGAKSSCRSRVASTRSSASIRCRRSSTSPGCRTRSRCCSRTLCDSRTETRSPPTTSKRSPSWDAEATPSLEIPFQPARVLMQDFTGVPAIVDLAAMRDAIDELGSDPAKINPLVPVDLVIDHSVQVDAFGNPRAFEINAERELRAQPRALRVPALGTAGVRQLPRRPAGDRDLPPGQPRVPEPGRVLLATTTASTQALSRHPRRHRLAHDDGQRPRRARLGRRRDRGRGGDARPADLDAAAAGRRLPARGRAARGGDGDRPRPHRHRDAARARRRLASSSSSTAPACTRSGSPTGRRSATCRRSSAPRARSSRSTARRCATSSSRAGRPRRSSSSTPTRASRGCSTTPTPRTRRSPRRWSSTSATSSPRSPDRSARRIASPSANAKPAFLESLADFNEDAAKALATATTEPSRSRFRPPTRRARNTESAPEAAATRRRAAAEAPTRDAEAPGDSGHGQARATASEVDLDHGRVVIAAITSCTNTSNPSVMIGAGLLAKKAVERGLQSQPWVKTSLAPGSTVVTDYLEASGLDEHLDELGFDLVGYGCTTCIGNSGPLPEAISEAVDEKDLVVCAVLSGNRNFEGRINQDVRNNYLASPPLCVAYALAGTHGHRPAQRSDRGELRRRGGVPLPISGRPRRRSSRRSPTRYARTCSSARYADVFTGDDRWRELETPGGRSLHLARLDLRAQALVLRGHGGASPPRSSRSPGARVLAVLGDSVTTDHISPAGAIKKDSPAGRWLIDNGVEPRDFNSYGSRRGNHEVMIRGTFANVRLRNKLVDREGGFTRTFPERRGDDDLRRGHGLRRGGCPARRAGRQGVRHPAPRATGRPREPRCSACAPCSPRASSASTARI